MLEKLPTKNHSSLTKVHALLNHKKLLGGDYVQALDEIYKILLVSIPFDRMSIGVCEGDSVILKWARAKHSFSNMKPGYRATLKGSGLDDVRQSKTPRIINDLLKYLYEHPRSESTKRVLADGILSSLTIPLIIHEEVIGFVFFSSLKLNTFKCSDLIFCAEVAEILSFLVYEGLPGEQGL